MSRRIIIFCLLVALSAIADTVTPDQYLASQPKPVWGANHKFPKLTIWQNVAYTNAAVWSNTVVEEATDWGYTLRPSDYADALTAANFGTPGAIENGFAKLITNNPALYKLSVIIDRTYPSPVWTNVYCTNAAGQFTDGVTNWPVLTNALNPVFCSEGPDGYWLLQATNALRSLLGIQSNCPISYFINGGENGLLPSQWTAGNGDGAIVQTAWTADPRVLAATNAAPYAGVNLGPFLNRYSTDRKAHYVSLESTLIKQTFTNRDLFWFFATDNEESRDNRTTNWWLNGGGFSWASDAMVTNFDIASYTVYYEPWVFNTFTNMVRYPGLSQNLLAEFLNGAGYNFTLGFSNSYCWVSAGYSDTDTNVLSDPVRFTGFLKCLYLGGMIGCTMGYFLVPSGTNGPLIGGPNFDAPFDSSCPPYWLRYDMQAARVQAFFTQHENLLTTNSFLLSDHAHQMYSNTPAYELTNTANDVTAHVMARQMYAGSQWLVCAWAAAGTNRNVTFNLPTLGATTLLARDSGAVYSVTAGGASLLDADGMFPDLPTASLGTINCTTLHIGP